MIEFKVGNSEMVLEEGKKVGDFISEMALMAMSETKKHGDIRITADDAVIRIERHPASVDDAHETMEEYLKEKCRMIVTRAIRIRSV
jgi:hypothetical protein